MIIKRLTLHNFGIYSGTNSFLFNNSKPVVLIGGMNGRGKTTFLEAILLALYGGNSFAYEESRKKSYSAYLKSYINKNDQSFRTYIELEFSMEVDEKTNLYIIKRSWGGNGKRISEQILAYKNGKEDDFLSNNWAIFIESILPSALSNFFFFDGEKIAELAVEQTNNQMKDSVKALLGIQNLDVLNSDLNRIVTKKNKLAMNRVELERVGTLKAKKQRLAEKITNIDQEIVEIQQMVSDADKEIERLEQNYREQGGTLASVKQSLYQEKAQLEVKLEEFSRKKLDLSQGELPLILVKDLLKDIIGELVKEREKKEWGIVNNRISRMYSKYTAENEQAGNQLEDFMRLIENEAKNNEDGIQFALSDQALHIADSLYSSSLEGSLELLISLQKEETSARERKEEIEQYLSVEINDSMLQETYQTIQNKKLMNAELKASIAALQKERSYINSEYISAEREHSALAVESVKTLEDHEEADRILKYIHYSIDIIEEFKVRLQRKKLGNLSSTITNCYKQLANKRDMVNRIEIDEQTLDFLYLDKDGTILDKESLSAGEKQLMVIAILWGLGISSKKRLPVIIDTPLSRLDSEHRMALIQRYFPKASDQTIILSTDSEIDEYYYEAMKESIGDEFTLIYHEESKTTTIQNGYFSKENQ